MRLMVVAALAVSTVVGVVMPSMALGQTVAQSPCELPEPTVLLEESGAVLQKRELPARPVWSSDTLPRSAAYAAYRAAITAAGADRSRPPVIVPTTRGDAERELWRREEANVALMYAGGGEVRAVRCIEAALFALQHARHSQLTQPTEFIAHILRKDGRLKIYFGAGDGPFPPQSVYGIDEVAADVAAGWMYVAALHNHPLQARGATSMLGVPVPSTSDVSLLSGLVARLGLREVWVTNGVYTGVVSAANLARFSGRE